MSRHHSTQSHRVQDLIKQVQETDQEYWEDYFDIYETEDGNIFDTLYDKEFTSIQDWAEFNIQMEFEDDSDTGYGGSMRDDD